MKKVGVVAVIASLVLGVLCFAAQPTASEVEAPEGAGIRASRVKIQLEGPFLRGSPTVYVDDHLLELERVVSLVHGVVGVREGYAGYLPWVRPDSEFTQAFAEEVDALLSDERFLEKAVRNAVQRAFPDLGPEQADGRVKHVREGLALKRRFEPGLTLRETNQQMRIRSAGGRTTFTFVRKSEGLGQEGMGSWTQGGGVPKDIRFPLVEVYLCAPTALSPETARQAIDVVESTCIDLRAELEQRMLKLCEEHLARAHALAESLEEERQKISQD